LLHKLRSGLVADPTRRLQGVVEADETYIGGHRPGRLGRGVGKTGVAIAVERRAKTAGAVRLAVIPHATTAVLTSFVQDSIQPQETTVFTDAWGAYATLRRLGIDHRPRKGGRGHQSAHLLPWAHTVFGNLKTWLRGTFHGVGPKHLQRHLDEFVFRFDRRWRGTAAIVGATVGGEPQLDARLRERDLEVRPGGGESLRARHAMGIPPTPANAIARSVTLGALRTALARDGALRPVAAAPSTHEDERL
jgi:transposase-like protein